MLRSGLALLLCCLKCHGHFISFVLTLFSLSITNSAEAEEVAYVDCKIILFFRYFLRFLENTNDNLRMFPLKTSITI